MIKDIEKFFNTDFSYLFKNGSWLTFSHTVSFIVNILLASAFARLLTQDDYGTYKYFLTLISFFSIFTLYGMNTALIRSVGNGFDNSIFKAIKIKFKWSLIGSIGSLIFGLYYHLKGNSEFFIILLIIALLIPMSGALSVFQPYLSGKKLFKLVSTNSIKIKLISVCTILITLLLTDEVWILITIFLASATILNGSFLYLNLKKYPPNKNDKTDDLSDGIHLSIMKGLSVAAGSLQGIALWHFLGPTGLAVYAFAVAPIEQIRPFISFIDTLFLPKLSQDSWSTPIKSAFVKKLFPFVLTITILVLVYILIIPFVYKILFPTYLESIIYSQIISISLVFTSIIVVIKLVLKAKKNIRALYTLSSITIAFDIILIIPAIYFFGLYGLAVAIVLQKIFTVIMCFSFVFSQQKK